MEAFRTVIQPLNECGDEPLTVFPRQDVELRSSVEGLTVRSEFLITFGDTKVMCCRHPGIDAAQLH